MTRKIDRSSRPRTIKFPLKKTRKTTASDDNIFDSQIQWQCSKGFSLCSARMTGFYISAFISVLAFSSVFQILIFSKATSRTIGILGNTLSSRRTSSQLHHDHAFLHTLASSSHSEDSTCSQQDLAENETFKGQR